MSSARYHQGHHQGHHRRSRRDRKYNQQARTPEDVETPEQRQELVRRLRKKKRETDPSAMSLADRILVQRKIIEENRKIQDEENYIRMSRVSFTSMPISELDACASDTSKLSDQDQYMEPVAENSSLEESTQNNLKRGVSSHNETVMYAQPTQPGYVVTADGEKRPRVRNNFTTIVKSSRSSSFSGQQIPDKLIDERPIKTSSGRISHYVQNSATVEGQNTKNRQIIRTRSRTITTARSESSITTLPPVESPERCPSEPSMRLATREQSKLGDLVVVQKQDDTREQITQKVLYVRQEKPVIKKQERRHKIHIVHDVKHDTDLYSRTDSPDVIENIIVVSSIHESDSEGETAEYKSQNISAQKVVILEDLEIKNKEESQLRKNDTNNGLVVIDYEQHVVTEHVTVVDEKVNEKEDTIVTERANIVKSSDIIIASTDVKYSVNDTDDNKSNVSEEKSQKTKSQIIIASATDSSSNDSETLSTETTKMAVEKETIVKSTRDEETVSEKETKVIVNHSTNEVVVSQTENKEQSIVDVVDESLESTLTESVGHQEEKTQDITLTVDSTEKSVSDTVVSEINTNKTEETSNSTIISESHSHTEEETDDTKNAKHVTNEEISQEKNSVIQATIVEQDVSESKTDTTIEEITKVELASAVVHEKQVSTSEEENNESLQEVPDIVDETTGIEELAEVVSETEPNTNENNDEMAKEPSPQESDPVEPKAKDVSPEPNVPNEDDTTDDNIPTDERKKKEPENDDYLNNLEKKVDRDLKDLVQGVPSEALSPEDVEKNKSAIKNILSGDFFD